MNSSTNLTLPEELSPAESNLAANPEKLLNLPGSFFEHACFCGHGLQYREQLYDHRKNRHGQCLGITIKPKVPPINLFFQA